eukprot:COSAG01_NODE_1769_length_9272_cov_34.805298_11_plen_136_part_00
MLAIYQILSAVVISTAPQSDGRVWQGNMGGGRRYRLLSGWPGWLPLLPLPPRVRWLTVTGLAAIPASALRLPVGQVYAEDPPPADYEATSGTPCPTYPSSRPAASPHASPRPTLPLIGAAEYLTIPYGPRAYMGT